MKTVKSIVTGITICGILFLHVVPVLAIGEITVDTNIAPAP